MHLLTDENGNPIAHGDHHHEHEHLHEHDHDTSSHDHHHAEPYTDRSQALLVYMFDHNVHHTLELLDVASKIEKEGKEEIAAKVREAAQRFEEGNALLHEALHLWDK